MSLSPILAVRKAIRTAIETMPQLQAYLKNRTIFDEAPSGLAPPYSYFGETQLRDWSVDEASGAEQFITLSVVTLHNGIAVAVNIGQQIVERLNHAPLSLDDHSLIDISFISMETRREQTGRLSKVNIRFRVTTEYQ